MGGAELYLNLCLQEIHEPFLVIHKYPDEEAGVRALRREGIN